jgi:putative ABC transport system permease protein
VLKLVLSGVLSRRRRFALGALAIVLGVGFVSGTLVLSQSARHSYDRLLSQVTFGVDVYVRGPETDRKQGISDFAAVPDQLLTRVRSVAGVAAAQGQVVRVGALVSQAGRFLNVGQPVYAYSWPAVAAHSPFVLVSGRAPAAPGEVVIDRQSAAEDGLRVGDRVRVSVDVASPLPAVVVGLVDPRVGGSLAAATQLFVSAPWAQQLTGIGGQWDLLEVSATPGLSPDALKARVTAVLPTDGTAALTSSQYADAQVQNLTQRSGSISTILLALSVLALLVGSAVILNTHRVLVAQRTHELATLRLLGASRRTVYVLILAEAAVVGFVASCVGAVLGIPVSYLLRAILAIAGQGAGSAPIDVQPGVLALTILLGTVVATAIAIAPAAHATRVTALAAIRDSVAPPPPPATSRVAVTATALVALAGGALVAVSLAVSPDQRLPLAIAGAAALGLAVIAALPVFAAPALRLLGALASRSGTAGMVARTNVLRNPRRTAAAAAALVVGLGLVTAVSVMAASAGGSVTSLVQRADRANLVVVSDAAPGLDPEVVAKLREAPGVAVVSELGSEGFTVDARADLVSAIETDTASAVLSLPVYQGSLGQLDIGHIAVTRSAALRNGYHVGDVVTAHFGEPQVYGLRIAAIINDNGITRDWVISWDLYGRVYHLPTIRAAFVRAHPGISAAELRRQVDFGVTGFPGITVDDAAAYAQAQAQAVLGPVGLIEGLVGLSIGVAILGVMNTVGLSVLERTGELGLLRIVGMSRAQVARTVYIEAAMAAVLGVVVGVVAGLAVGITVVDALSVQGITTVVIPWLTLLAVSGCVIAGTMVAATLPARRAARMGKLEAVRHTF